MKADQTHQDAEDSRLPHDMSIAGSKVERSNWFSAALLRAPDLGSLFVLKRTNEHEVLKSKVFTLEAAQMASDTALSFMVVVGVVAYLAASNQSPFLVAIILALGLLSVGARINLKAKVDDGLSMDIGALRRAQLQIVAASFLGTIIWVIGLVAVYPPLDPYSKMVFLVLLLGSTTVGASFMTLVPPSYVLHFGILFVAFVASNLIHPTDYANVLSALLLLFGYELFRVSWGSNTSSMRVASRLAAAKYEDTQKENELQKQAIDSHAKMVATLRANSESKNLYLAKISHEFRAPLQVIVSTVDLLTALLSKHPNKLVGTSLENLDTATEQLAAFSNDLADYLKSNSTQIKVKSEPIELIAFLAGCLGMYDVRAKNKDLTLRFNHKESSLQYLGDAVRLRQIMTNLIDNAVKYTASGFIELDCESLPDGAFAIVVRDSGSGISETAQNSIFEPWFRADETTQGMGLGLAVVKATADLIGAKIHLKSMLGLGTELTLILPATKRKRT